jgi:hypothetical protein
MTTSRRAHPGSERFPFNNFTYCLTLFSKFFSSFPHGTCSLSVSRRYLALDEIYHPICAAFPNNATLRTRITGAGGATVTDGILTLYDTPFQGIYSVGPRGKRVCRLQLEPANGTDYNIELFPLHSPLLGESLLVSLPPLINMLKFSGYPHLI